MDIRIFTNIKLHITLKKNNNNASLSIIIILYRKVWGKKVYYINDFNLSPKKLF